MNPLSPNQSHHSLDRETLARLRALAQDTDPGLYRELLSTFATDLMSYLTAIRNAVAVGDVAGLQQHVHAMKGASMNTGALSLGRMCAAVEDATEARNYTAVPAMLVEVEGEAAKVQADIALELSSGA